MNYAIARSLTAVPVRSLLIIIISALVVLLPRPIQGIGPDNYGYTAGAIPILFEDLTVPAINAPPVLGNADDDAVTVPIGFSFVFYGVAYNTVSITSNGTIMFGGVDTDWVPVDISTTAPTKNLPMIAAFWHDWTFQYFGSDAVYYATLGTVGNRRLVIRWNAAESATGSGTDTVFFEAKLFEGSNNIEFHYDDATISDDASVSNGLDATVGIRDASGQISGRNLQWSFNQAVINDGSAIRFVAPVFKVKSITRLTNHHMLLNCLGAPSLLNHIQASPDLSSGSFVTLGAASADSGGNFQFEDANAGNFTRRFYRVAVP
jgi:hypothetical protein